MRVRGKPVSCCFTGHRPAKLPWGTDEGDERCLRLKARLREVIARAVEDGYTHFICGMAEGCCVYRWAGAPYFNEESQVIEK